jgi:glycosyltransferase involved in cell wall biosynthesis
LGRYSFWEKGIFFSTFDNSSDKLYLKDFNLVKLKDQSFKQISFTYNHQEFLEKLDNHIASDNKKINLVQDSNNKRVMVFTHALTAGGAERQWCYVAVELKKKGYDPVVVLMSGKNPETVHYLPILEQNNVDYLYLGEPEIIGAVNDFLGPRLEKKISVPDVFFHLPQLFLDKDNSFPYYIPLLIYAIRDIQPGAILCQLDPTNILGAIAGLLMGIPNILLSFRNYNPTNFSYLYQDWFDHYYKIIIKSERVVLSGNSTLGNQDYANWLGIDSKRINLLKNIVPREELIVPAKNEIKFKDEMNIDRDYKIIIGIFRFSEEKRPMLFMEVAYEIIRQFENVTFLIAGEGRFYSEMENFINERKLQKKIRILGRRQDTKYLLTNSDIILLASSFEGTPNVLLEAQCAGIPIVATDAGGVRDCVLDGKTGFVVPINDKESLVQKSLRLLKEDNLRLQMSEAGKEYMKNNFTGSEVVESLENMVLKRKFGTIK